MWSARQRKITAILFLGAATGALPGTAYAQDITLGPGDDRYQIDATSTASIDGGAGEDTLVLSSPSTLSIFAGQTVNFERMEVVGDWAYGGTGSFPLGIEVKQNGGLYTTAESIGTGKIVSHGKFGISASGNSEYGGNFSGDGFFIKDGSGRLAYRGTNTSLFGGQIYVAAGTLDLENRFLAPNYYVRPLALLTSGRSGTIDGTLTNGLSVTVNQFGMIDNYAPGGRAIDLVLQAVSSNRLHDIVNNGTIRGSGEAIRFQYVSRNWRTSIINNGLIEGLGGTAINLVPAGGIGVASYFPAITNSSSGAIRSTGATAINGSGGILNNSGLIESVAGANSTADGVNYSQIQGNTGAIIGARNGVIASAVVNSVGGSIIGRNGAGVIGIYGGGSGGVGSVTDVTNAGYIAGGWDGVSQSANGDGINLAGINSIITINNSGVIAGLGAHGTDGNGLAFTSDGIQVDNATINNNGVIDGADYGTRIAGTINNRGVIIGGLAGIGSLPAPVPSNSSRQIIHNYGTITGRNGLAVQLSSAADQFYYYPGSTVNGAIDGGAAIDEIFLSGDASTNAVFATPARNVEWVRVVNGTWTLTNLGSYSTGTRINIFNGQTAILEVPVDTSFGGWLTGTSSATAIKRGAGTLFIDLGLWAGTLTIEQGGVTPTPGAQFPTSGGDAIGTSFIGGDFVQGAGSSYIADLGVGGSSDLILVGGRASIEDGARLVVNRDGGADQIGSRYAVLAAAGGVDGDYTLVQPANADSQFRILRRGDAVMVELARTPGNLLSLPQTANERAVAPVVAALGTSNAAFAALTLDPDDRAVRDGLSALAGESHASIRTVVLRDTRALADSVLARATEAEPSRGPWLQATGPSGTNRGAGGIADLRRNGWGLVGGADMDIGDVTRVGMAIGYSRSSFDLADRASGGGVRSRHMLVYARTRLDDVSLSAGIGYARLENDLRRNIILPGLAERLASQYGGRLLHGFAEIGTRVGIAGGSVEPFAGVAAYRIRNDAFAETGGSSALSGDAQSEDFAISTVGLRTTTPLLPGLSARSQIGWQHTLGGGTPQASLMFGSGQRFTVTGAELPRDAAALSLDLSWRAARNVVLTIGYQGTIGGGNDDNNARAQLSMRF